MTRRRALSDDHVRLARQLADEGMRIEDIAARFGASYLTTSRALHGYPPYVGISNPGPVGKITRVRRFWSPPPPETIALARSPAPFTRPAWMPPVRLEDAE